MKLYGPYICKDGRRRVVVDDGIKKTTKLYARYLIEQKLGRELASNEVVDHINDDKTDDRIDNLQVLTYSESNGKGIRAAKKIDCICKCGKEFTTLLKDHKRNRSVGKSGPYCSKRCAGYYSHPAVVK